MEIRDIKSPEPSCEVNRSTPSSRQNRPRLERKGSSPKTKIATLAFVGAGLRSVSASPIGRTEEVGLASGGNRLPWTPEDTFSGRSYFNGKRSGIDSVDWSNPANYAGVDWNDPKNYAGVDWNDPKNYAGVNFKDPTLYLPTGSAPASQSSHQAVTTPAPVPEALETWSPAAEKSLGTCTLQTLSSSQRHQALQSATKVQAHATSLPVTHPLQSSDFSHEDAGRPESKVSPAASATPTDDVTSARLPLSSMAAASSTKAPAVIATTLLTSTSPSAAHQILSTPLQSSTQTPAQNTATSSVAASLKDSTLATTTLLTSTARQTSFTATQGATQTSRPNPAMPSFAAPFSGIAVSQNAILVVNLGSTAATFSFWKNYDAYQPNFDSAYASMQLAPGAQKLIALPASWSGRVQKMTGAVSDPATWGEVTFDGGYGNTYVDVSYIRGYNAPLKITDENDNLTEGTLTDLRVAAPTSLKIVDSGGTSVLPATEGFDGTVRQDVINYERASGVGTSAYIVNSDNQATRGVASKHLIFTFG